MLLALWLGFENVLDETLKDRRLQFLRSQFGEHLVPVEQHADDLVAAAEEVGDDCLHVDVEEGVSEDGEADHPHRAEGGRLQQRPRQGHTARDQHVLHKRDLVRVVNGFRERTIQRRPQPQPNI